MSRIYKILVTLCATVLFVTAQVPPEKSRWIDRVGRYVQGTPWRFDSVLPTTHGKYLLHIGRIGIQDEYLSPISHTGTSFGISVLMDGKLKSKNNKWHYYGESEMNVGWPKNQANHTTMYVIEGRYLGGPAYRLLNRRQWLIDISPAVAVNIQGNIKMSNSNNVVNVKGDIGLDAWGRIMYRIPWEVMPVNFSYSIQVPLFHMACHPHFGQSYYEYVSGENRELPRFYAASLHNTFALRQRLLVDLPIRSTTVTVGVEHSYMKQMINSTQYRKGTWSVMVGISLDYLVFSGNRSTRSAQILSPMHNYIP